MKFANLHLHSTYSDAGFTPTQLVQLGKALGYKALALTDHETDGGNDEFFRAAKREEIQVITGTEFYAHLNGKKMHLTALDFDREAPQLRALIKERCRLQAAWLKECFELGVEKEVIKGVTWDDVLDYAGESRWLCTDTLAEVLRIKKAIPPEGMRYVKENTTKDPEMKAKKAEYPTAEEVIKAVRSAGGVIALAHPTESLVDIVGELVELGLNGIEVDHPGIAPEVLPLCDRAAQQYDLYRCGGTDHTGPMSCCGGKHAIPVWSGITEEEFVILKERRLG